MLQYGQSEYVRQFGMNISDDLMNFNGRLLEPPTLKYNPASKQPEAVRPSLHIGCRNDPIVSLRPETTGARRDMELVSLSCCKSP